MLFKKNNQMNKIKHSHRPCQGPVSSLLKKKNNINDNFSVPVSK